MRCERIGNRQNGNLRIVYIVELGLFSINMYVDSDTASVSSLIVAKVLECRWRYTSLVPTSAQWASS